MEVLERLRHKGEEAAEIAEGAAAWLGTAEAGAMLPVLLVTGQRLHARDGPVLRKPFNAGQLQRAVAALL